MMPTFNQGAKAISIKKSWLNGRRSENTAALELGMVTKIGPSRPIRHFLKEWRKHKGLTQQQFADRLPMGEDGKATGKDVVSRWERNERGMSMDVQAALAEALDIEPGDLFRDPLMPSADELLKMVSPEKRREIFAVIQTMLKSA